jgi:hypothetical protein
MQYSERVGFGVFCGQAAREGFSSARPTSARFEGGLKRFGQFFLNLFLHVERLRL